MTSKAQAIEALDEITFYVVRYMDAYGKIISKLIQSQKVIDKWIKNWGWQSNEDGSGLEVFKLNFKSKLMDLYHE